MRDTDNKLNLNLHIEKCHYRSKAIGHILSFQSYAPISLLIY